ncbi:MAG TPA: preprotein translocase subunit Sec61beta [Pyrodictium sp.]|nr:preprotein translocase subunit Sec61beta [Pyrodictium sp.]HIQ55844.1 preprotein translocase subunit Sec61beta [Pyrodictium sp.]
MSRRKKKTSYVEENDSKRDTEPTLLTAAGLLAFSEEEESYIQLSPTQVLIATIALILAIVLGHLIVG